MSKSTHQIQIKGVDQTGGAFQSIKNRAAATATSIRSVVGGALAAAGAYLSVRAVAGAVNELGNLSDIAQKASISVDDLTKTTKSLNILGVGVNASGLAKAFQLMEKNTGRYGMKGFYETIGEIGKIPDVSARAQAAMKAFGKSGLEFMPLINAAKTGTKALEDLTKAFPGVSQSAADAGDDIADGAAIVSSQFKTWWLDAVGSIAEKFTGALPTSFRQSMAVLMAYADYYLKSIGDIVKGMWLRVTRGFGLFPALANVFGTSVGSTIEKIFGPSGIVRHALLDCEEFFAKFWQRISRGFGLFTASANAAGAAIAGTWEKLFGTGGSWEDVGRTIADAWKGGWEDYAAEVDDIAEEYRIKQKLLGRSLSWKDIGGLIGESWRRGFEEYDADLEEIEESMDERARRHAERLVAAENLESNYQKAATTTSNRQALEGDVAAATKSPAVRNTLIMGESNTALKTAMLGPQLQDQQKKTNELLEKIAKNTEKTAENTKESGDDLAVADM